MDKVTGKVYGIDLGTTTSEIAVVKDGKPVILKNQEGSEITPSVVFFTGSEDDLCYVGTQAKNSIATNPKQAVRFIKRFMGQKGPSVNHIAPSGKEYTPEMISAKILQKLCQDAEMIEGDPIKNVVITVPAYFDDASRTATKQAGDMAGLNVLRIINEPTAAALAFGIDTKQSGKVLVYDLGGGTFDVTLMDIRDGEFNVIATDGEKKLGGKDFDQKIVALVVEKLREQECVINDTDDALFSDLMEKAERIKKNLSVHEVTNERFRIQDKTYRVSVTREEFEKASAQLLKSTKARVESILRKNNLSWEDIDHLVVVGGSTFMPMVRNMLKDISGKEIAFTVDPNTAVSKGAAILGASLSNDHEQEDFTRKGGIRISDVTSQSLGIITVADDEHGREIEVNTVIIPHNTKIPARKGDIVFTRVDNQTHIRARITEGNDPKLEYLTIIGEQMFDIKPHPKESPVEVVFMYDIDQTIQIELIDRVDNVSLGMFEIERRQNLSEGEVKAGKEIIQNGEVF